MSMKTTVWLGCCLFCLALPTTTRGFDITAPDGKPTAEIVIPQDAEESSRLAAQELTDYLEKISGAKLATRTGTSTAQRQIVIGTLKTLKDIPQKIRKKLDETEKIESFCLLAEKDRFYIVGKRRVAELFGVYTFLEKDLGVRWFKTAMPEDSGEYVPKQTSIRLKDFFRFEEPGFIHRKLDQCFSYVNVEPLRGKSWGARNKFQVSGAYGLGNHFNAKHRKFFEARTPDWRVGAGGHTTFHAAVPKELFKTHPEYFPLIDGKRVMIAPGGCMQACITNPDVKDRVIKTIDDLFDRYGEDHVSYLFGMTDSSHGWCECPECRKLDTTKVYDNLNISTRFHKVAAELAAKVYQKHPKAHLRLWAYHTYRDIPQGVTIDPRMEVIFCIHSRCYGHRLDDPRCPRNVKMLNLLKQWQKLSDKIQTYEYTTATSPYYAPMELRLAHDIKLYHRMGLNGWKEEAAYPDSKFYPIRKNDPRPDIFPSNWQYLYVAAKLLWDPELDVQDILRDAESKYYGNAYPAMKKYHDYRRKLWEHTPECLGYPTGDQRRPNLLNSPESTQTLLTLLAKAEQQAQGDKLTLTRIAKDRYYLQKYWIKANEDMKARLSKTFYAPAILKPITIDGKGDDPDWVKACYANAFRETFTKEKKPIPEPLATTVGILSDNDHLYFLMTAKEPKPEKMKLGGTNDGNLWQMDSMEILIAPPNAARSYYHIIATPDGAIYDAVNPGENRKENFGVLSKARILKDRYVIELKVPIRSMGADFKRGNIWRIHFTRNRTIKDQFNRNSGYSIDGEANHDTIAYRALEIGKPYLKNGSLDHVDDGKLKGWAMEKATPKPQGMGFAADIHKGGRIYQLLTDLELWQAPKERNISLTLKASGKGKLAICFYHYHDTKDGKAKHGYRRKFIGTTTAKVVTLNEKPQIVTLNYTIPADQWCGLGLHAWGQQALIDDVSLKKLP